MKTWKLVDVLHFKSYVEMYWFVHHFKLRYSGKRSYSIQQYSNNVAIISLESYPTDVTYYLRWLIDNKYLRSNLLQRLILTAIESINFVESIDITSQRKLAKIERVLFYPHYLWMKLFFGKSDRFKKFKALHINFVI